MHNRRKKINKIDFISCYFSPFRSCFFFLRHSMRIFRTCRLPRFCYSRLQGKCYICSRQRVVVRKTSSKCITFVIKSNRTDKRTMLINANWKKKLLIAASLARRESSTDIEMCLLQKNMLVHRMFNRCVIKLTNNRTTLLSLRAEEKKSARNYDNQFGIALKIAILLL